MGLGKTWSRQEEEYLIEKWGSLSVKTIAKNLGRSENAVLVRKNRLGCGAFLQCGEYITWNQLQIALGKEKSSSGYKMISWVRNRNFPVHTKKSITILSKLFIWTNGGNGLKGIWIYWIFPNLRKIFWAKNHNG